MDSVTGPELAQTLGEHGGLGVIHRFQSISEQKQDVRAVSDGVTVGASIGVSEGYQDRARELVSAGADLLMIDVAHAHAEHVIEAVKTVREMFPEVTLAVGNVATAAGATDLSDAGADIVKIGIGCGSHCTTREVTGVGVPQLSAIYDAYGPSINNYSIIADGGIRKPGDAVKALMAGADAVMLGREFGGTYEAPGELIDADRLSVDGDEFKKTRGMSTTEANESRPETEQGNPLVDEGVSAHTPVTGSVKDIVDGYVGGIKHALSYLGGHTLDEARNTAIFVEASRSARERNGSHGIELADSQ
jgi:IMP dehydrogenase